MTANTSIAWSVVARRIRVPLGFLFAAFYIWRAHPTWWSVAAAGLLALLGISIRAVASGHVKKNVELTMTGPYAYTRNPLYLGSIVIAIGFTIGARDLWIAFILIVFFCAIYMPVIRSEARHLRQHFAGYDEYARRVPSLVPRTLWFRGAMTGFSRELYFRHREYNAMLGAAGMMAVLIGKILWFPG